MIRYSVRKNGVITNMWTSDSGLDETHREPGFGPEGSFEIIIEDITAELEAQQTLNQKLALGKVARQCCDEIYDLIAGYNLSRNLTLEQIDQMELTFSSVAQALQAKRPDKAKQLIAQIEADGTLVTAEMLNDVNSIFTKYGI